MSFPNVTDIVATTIQSRTRKIADNVRDNNGLLKALDKRGRVKTFSGGNVILQELSFQENANAGFYSGYDKLPVAASDVISAAEFDIKQAAVPVVISGLEMLQNAGREQMIDLLEGRMEVAESTLANLICDALYSDGTGSGGKEITGLDAAISTSPTSGVYGGIDRATWAFWQNYYNAQGMDASTVQGFMNTAWSNLVRGADRPDLIIMDNNMWSLYLASLQAQQRFHQADVGDLGFPTLKFMSTDVVLDGGIGGNATTKTAYFINTKYLHWRPHAKRNMVPLSPNKRYSVDQDAEVQILAWAGNLTCSGARYQGRLVDTN